MTNHKHANGEPPQNLLEDALAKTILIKHPTGAVPASIHTSDDRVHRVIGALLKSRGLTPDVGFGALAIRKKQNSWRISNIDGFSSFEPYVGKVIEIPPQTNQGDEYFGNEEGRLNAERTRTEHELTRILDRELDEERDRGY